MKELETFNNCYLHYVNNSSQSKSQQQKTHIFSLVDAVTDSTKDIQIHDEVVSKLLYLYPDDVNLYFKMGYIYKTANNTEKAISWHKMGYQINPRDARNTAELCELLLIKKRISAVFDLDKNNLFESFHADKKFLAVYARCHLEKLNFHRALFYLLKLIEMTAPIKSVSHSDKHLKWLNYHDAAYAYFSTGLIDKAVSYNAKALDLAQKFILSIEDKMLSFSNLLFYNVYTYFDSDKYFQLCKGINMFYPNKTPFTARVGSWSSKDSKDSKDSQKIRLGYVSSDFIVHAAANFTIPILQYCDRSRFELHMFSNSNEIAPIFNHIQAERYYIKDLSDEAAAKLIYEAGIDILFDLNGHTFPNRLGVFAYNPCPVQITYLGYPNTTGLDAMTYRITDRVTNPPESTEKYSEQLLYMPKCFLLYNSYTMVNPTTPRKTPKPVLLASLNKENKISVSVLDTWKRILAASPTTRILIKIDSFEAAERRAYYTDHLQVTDDRLTIISKLSNHEYEKMFTKFDIMLDTFPYSGTTTTCDTLLNSVPVVTLYNPNYHVHNVSASVLQNAGLPDLVAYSTDQYVSIVKALIDNPHIIDKYKDTIHDKFKKSMAPKPFMEAYESLLLASLKTHD